MKILIKYPSRGRPKAFFEGLDSIVWNLHDADSVHIVAIADLDDTSMNRPDFFNKFCTYGKKITCNFDASLSKISAINRTLYVYDEETSDRDMLLKPDIIVVMSDDMRFTSLYFDKIIRDQFADDNFDKLLHFPDQDAKHALATMYIAGRTFYERFNYIYHPSYQSLWCDNEIMEVAQKLGKYQYVDYPGVISHLNPAYGHGEKDEMFIAQQEVGWSVDQENYNRRKEEWGMLEGEELIKYMQKI